MRRSSAASIALQTHAGQTNQRSGCRRSSPGGRGENSAIRTSECRDKPDRKKENALADWARAVGRRRPGLPDFSSLRVRWIGAIEVLKETVRRTTAGFRPCRQTAARFALARAIVGAWARVPTREIFLNIAFDLATHLVGGQCLRRRNHRQRNDKHQSRGRK